MKRAAILVLTLTVGCSDVTSTGAVGIKLNEVLALSDTSDDWLELHNPSDQDVDLGGFVLQDQGNYWTVPQAKLAAGAYLQIICDGSGSGGKASFKLTSKGESLTLKDSDGQVLDRVTFPALQSGKSWGRVPDGTGAWTGLDRPTPGAANTGGQAGDGAALATDGGVNPDALAGKPTSAACSANAECLSQICHRKICVSPYRNKAGEACSGNGQCLSLVCTGGKCVAGTAAAGAACLDSAECATGMTCDATAKTCK